MSEIRGDIAQLGERLPCKQEVAGSIPTISTKVNNVSRLRIETKPNEVGLARKGGATERVSFRRRKRTIRSLRRRGPVAQLARAYD